jgi:hypothetical protein
MSQGGEEFATRRSRAGQPLPQRRQRIAILGPLHAARRALSEAAATDGGLAGTDEDDLRSDVMEALNTVNAAIVRVELGHGTANTWTVECERCGMQIGRWLSRPAADALATGDETCVGCGGSAWRSFRVQGSRSAI